MVFFKASFSSVDFSAAIATMWKLLGIIWLIGAWFRQPAVARANQSTVSWFLQTFLAALAFALLLTNWFRYGILASRFVPEASWPQFTGFALALIGCFMAIWARVTLGGNWSARPSLQQNHALITNGPYALARHPIYAGFVLAFGGTVLVIGEYRVLLGFVLILIRLAMKMNLEEKLMLQAFPHAYPDYRKRVKALIPGIL